MAVLSRRGEARVQADRDLARVLEQGGDEALAGFVAELCGSAPAPAAALAAAIAELPATAAALAGTVGPVAVAGEFEMRLLGTPEVRRRGGDSLHWRLRRCLQVLAYLASTPELSATREELEDAIWPGAGQDDLRRNFHPTLSHLRRGLGTAPSGCEPPIVLEDGVYRLGRGRVWWLDVREFRLAAGTGHELRGRDPDRACRALESAWRLYRGELLAGWPEPWVEPRREALARTYVTMLADLGALHADAGRIPEALDALRAQLVVEPLEEAGHVAVMQLYARQGRRDLVRLQFNRLCTLLHDELGVEPLDETNAAYHRLMA